MVELEKWRFLTGLITVLLGIDALLSLPYMFRFAGIFLLFLGGLSLLRSKEELKEDFKDRLPRGVTNLFRYPRLPYFQTGIVLLLVFGAIFFLAEDFTALIFVLIGLGVTQLVLTTFKKNIEDKSKIFLVIKIQLFLLFSTFVYINSGKLLLLRPSPPTFFQILFVIVWIIVVFQIYFKNFKSEEEE
ncbi:MAG: hypothetical protein KGY76_08570 [Candidatus Thermoplasmatota archaeon]|nr:hypothetical protein [Candidatus Thermoplasmatota archaeon]